MLTYESLKLVEKVNRDYKNLNKLKSNCRKEKVMIILKRIKEIIGECCVTEQPIPLSMLQVRSHLLINELGIQSVIPLDIILTFKFEK